MKARLTYLGFALGWALVRALPERLAAALFDRGADRAYRRDGKGVRRLRENLARVVGGPPPEDLVQRAVRSYARYWREVFRLPVTPPKKLIAGMRTVDEERMRKAYADGGGAVMVLPHMGNWDHAGAWAVLTGMNFTTVAERLKPEALFDKFLEFRQRIGMEVIPLTGGERPPFDVLAERLRAGGMICLLGDRDLTAKGIPVDFFGGTAKFPAGPAALAIRTGATLLPVTLWFDGDGWALRVHEAVDVPEGSYDQRVRAMTQRIADAFAEGIAEHPEDWHMLQRLWVDDDAGGVGVPASARRPGLGPRPGRQH